MELIKKLNNGIEIPAIAAGMWQIPDDVAERVVRDAIEVGYRHIDTAQAYENEAGVGRGIKASGIRRDEIFVTSKILGETVRDYRIAAQEIDEALVRLDMDYVDLMIIHAPTPWSVMYKQDGKDYYEENAEMYRALEDALKAGKVRAIGVSNFQINDLEYLLAHTYIKPAVNQILCNITHYPKQLIDWCHAHGIDIMAFSPNATGNLGGKTIEQMAAKYNVTVPQLGNRFDLQLGAIVLPKTTHKEYLIENLALDFEISDDDMAVLQSIGQYTGWKGSFSE